MDELAQASTTAFYTLDAFHGVRAAQVVRAIEQAMEGDYEPWSELVLEAKELNQRLSEQGIAEPQVFTLSLIHI